MAVEHSSDLRHHDEVGARSAICTGRGTDTESLAATNRLTLLGTPLNIRSSDCTKVQGRRSRTAGGRKRVAQRVSARQVEGAGIESVGQRRRFGARLAA